MIDELFHFKPGVKRDHVHPMMFAWLGVVAAVKQLERRFGLVLKTPAQIRGARTRVGPHIHLQLKGTLGEV